MNCVKCGNQINLNESTVDGIKDMCVDCFLSLSKEEKEEYKKIAFNNGGTINIYDRTDDDNKIQELVQIKEINSHSGFIGLMQFTSVIILIASLIMGFVFGETMGNLLTNEFNFEIALLIFGNGIVIFFILYSLACILQNISISADVNMQILNLLRDENNK